MTAACTTPDIDSTSGQTPDSGLSGKIVNSPQNADAVTLMLYLSDEAAEAAENAARTRAGATRSGSVEIDEILAQTGAVSLRRIFPCDPRHEERTRAAGLHRWYMAEFSGECAIESVARRFAGVAEVQFVQFNTELQRADRDLRAVPLHRAAAATDDVTTRADGQMPFNDPYLPRQWNMNNTGLKSIAQTARAGADVDAFEAWRICTGDPRVVVAVVDEGVKYTHPDLAANMWVNTAELNGTPGVDDDGNGYVDDIYGYNFADGGAISWAAFNADGTSDDTGHATHIAGVISAVNNNGRGVSSIAGGTGAGDGVKIMSCQVHSGSNSNAMLMAMAAKYAADNGASVLQCSLGYATQPQSDDEYEKVHKVENDAFKYFESVSNCEALDGGVIIFAAGNDARNAACYPGAYRDYISVTSFSTDFLPAYYTNYDAGCNIAAPGGDYKISTDHASSNILSTMPSELNEGDDYGYMQGTSMACPHVSGVAALGLSYALQRGRHFSLGEFKSLLLTSVNNIDRYLNGTKDNMNLNNYYKKMGTGAVDAFRMLMQVEGTPCLRAGIGAAEHIDLSPHFGQSASNLTYLDVEMSDEECAKLGLSEAPSISYGKLLVNCRRPGVGRLKVRAIAGGTQVGTGSVIGGMVIEREFAIIARATEKENGGWL